MGKVYSKDEIIKMMEKSKLKTQIVKKKKLLWNYLIILKIKE